MRCPDDHRHGATTTCYYSHGCRCDVCSRSRLDYERARQDKRRKAEKNRSRGGSLLASELCRWVHGVPEIVTGAPVEPTDTHYMLNIGGHVQAFSRDEWMEVIA